MVKVANFVFNSFLNDSRVLKESLSLVNYGYEVSVVAHHDKGLNREEQRGKLTIQRVA